MGNASQKAFWPASLAALAGAAPATWQAFQQSACAIQEERQLLLCIQTQELPAGKLAARSGAAILLARIRSRAILTDCSPSPANHGRSK